MSKKPFCVTNEDNSRCYIAYGDETASLDTVWASQKCWFTGGSIVTITDTDGNSKTFVKEEYKHDCGVEA